MNVKMRNLPIKFPGEDEAIAIVKRMGAEYGYGNLIGHLKDAWSESHQRAGVSKQTANAAAGHICVWCYTDTRTGCKVEDLINNPPFATED